jgi:hypothetical protein
MVVIVPVEVVVSMTVSGKALVTEVGTFMPPVVVVKSEVGTGVKVNWARPVALMATVKRPDRVWEYLILEG